MLEKVRKLCPFRVVIIAVLLAGCPKKPSLSPDYQIVSVYYGTDRNVTGKAEPGLYYGEEPGIMQFGICQVSVPLDRRMGVLTSPTVIGIESQFGMEIEKEDPKKHVILISINLRTEDNFLFELKEIIEQSDRREAFVFIHGYNVTFRDSCRRAAQIAFDLQFTGVPMMYSWPSNGRSSPLDYVKDETDITRSTANFEQFILMVAEKTGARMVHLIAHSMGNRALLHALSAIAVKRGEVRYPTFNQVVLAAPDIDAEVFRQLASAVKKASQRATLYASSNDEALKLSRWVHGYQRAGESGPYLIVIDGIDTIDVSMLDTSLSNHSFYAEHRSVISDLHELFRYLRPPRERFNLREKTRDGLTYWEFRP